MTLPFIVIQAKSSKDAAEGLTFMREMSKWNSLSDLENGVVPVGVVVGGRVFPAGPGHFGRELRAALAGAPRLADPLHACNPLTTPLTDKFAVAQRGQCTFAQKVRNIQAAGAKLAIIIDNVPDSSHESTAMFAMSGDGKDDIEIPAVFLFTLEGQFLTDAMATEPDLTVTVGELKSLQRQHEVACEDGNCETVLERAGTPAETESFDHLKKVLSQLVAQFELSLSQDETPSTAPRCASQVLDEPFQTDKVLTKVSPATAPSPPQSPQTERSTESGSDHSVTIDTETREPDDL